VTTPPTTAAPSTTPPTTEPPTTAAPPLPTCAALDGADDTAKQGDAVQAQGTTPQLANVQVQASECVDEVSFLFPNGTPAWSISYEPGSAAYQIRFAAATVSAIYPGSNDFRPQAPSGVGEMKLVSGADGTMTWAIGFAEQHPFRVQLRDDVIALQFATVEAPRAMTCSVPDAHAEYDVPPGWFVETNPDLRPCTEVGAAPFTIYPASDGPTGYGLVVLGGAPAAPSDYETVVSTSDTTVAGRAATITETEATGQGLFPAGYHFYRYSVDWAPAGTLQLSVGGDPGADFDARKAGLDAIAASVRYVG
jgi:hypothetical protein